MSYKYINATEESYTAIKRMEYAATRRDLEIVIPAK